MSINSASTHFNAMVLLFSLLLTYFLLMALIPSLRSRMMDEPNFRSSHRLPTPRGGGVVFLVTIVPACCIAFFIHSGDFNSFNVLPLLVVPLAIVGLFDDRYDLGPGFRYLMQLITAVLLIILSPLKVPYQYIFLHFPLLNILYVLLCFVLLVIAITAVINFTNFMDGLDGLVSGCMAAAIFSIVIKVSAPWPLWVLVGSLLGFLVWNWSPAKVFMGDVGSTFLGAIFAALVLQAPTWPEALALLLLASPLLGDACICVPRRLLSGQQVFQAHRLHLFQRLHQAGWPHARVSSLYIAATAILAIALLWGGLFWVITLAVLELLLGIWLDQHVAVPFSVASRS